MGKLFFIICLLITNVALGQINRDELLKAFINDPDFCKKVIPGCDRCDTIKIVDTLNYFEHKGIFPVHGNVYSVSSDYTIDHPMPKSAADLRKWTCTNLFVTVKHQKRRRYTVHYFHSPTNGLGYIVYKLRRSKFSKVDMQFGQL